MPATEFLLIRHAWAGLRAVVAPPKFSAHTYVEKNLFGVFGLILLIGGVSEIPLHHLLLPGSDWGVAAALDLLVLYSAVWVLGVYGVMAARPHETDGDTVIFHRGPFATVHVPIKTVVEASALKDPDVRKLRRSHRDACFFGFKGGDLVHLRLSAPALVRHAYPIPRQQRTVELFVASDRPHALCALLHE